jgi:uncharacterized DUF497 family protein
VNYEWHEAKRLSNIQKHGIDFIDIPELFSFDVLIIEDIRFDNNERRFIATGLVNGQVIVVAYAERGENIRIITARKATKYEQINYFQQISN